MTGKRKPGASSSEEEVLQLEDAVELLVEELVVPVLPVGQQVDREEAMSPETQEIVARQVHATVLLYNYYYRKQFPQLEFAWPYRFCLSSSLTVSNKNFHMYLNMARKRLDNEVEVGLSVTDNAIFDACSIAEALDPTKDSPEMITWPITKVAVLLLNQKKKVCLLELGSQTKGVWSTFEKDISSDLSAHELSDESMALTSKPYLLQQIAYSEVELKTGMKRTDLRFIGEHRVYSLSKKETTTLVLLLEYDQTVDSKFKEIPLDVLIERMRGPIFKYGLFPITTSVVEYYHLLPYKEILLNVLNREWLSMPKEQEAFKNKFDDSGTNKGSTSKKRKERNTNSKRKSGALKTKVGSYAKHGDGQSPRKDVQASECVQMEMNRTENNDNSTNVPQVIIPTPCVDPVINDYALKGQKEKVTEKSDGITSNMNVQRYATLQLLRNMRDDTRRQHFFLGDRSAEYELDIQTILTETEMTPKLMAILKKYENSCKTMEAAHPFSSTEGCQTMNIKRKKLKEAILLRNKCQELDDICRQSYWSLPRYTVLPSDTVDMYQANVHLSGPDFNLSIDGDMKVTPHEARDSAASNMLSLLQQKARED